MSNTEDFDNAYDIAIVGMSGRFPGARNINEFWRNLRDGVESITFFTDEELRATGIEAETLSDPGYIKAAGTLDGLELFDASFFGFNPREAEVLDPQQRIFLECAWESLENAGYDPETYRGLIGVYAGTSMSSYLFNVYSNPELVGIIGDFQVQLGNDKDNLPTSVSYKLNLKGPSIAIQTACSTSLVAISVACQSLLSYQCDMALAGGVRIALPQPAGYFYQEGGIMSPDGHCRAFDAKAQGTVGGNGIGIVVLKRLTDAITDGDCIHAIIKGTAINNDGSFKVGYTAPSIEGQAQVITMAQAAGGIDPRSVTYIEAHGTGTDLGDPIEIAALTQAFRAGTVENGFCALGSLKTNVGHLDTAAGVAGLIKTVMALKHKVIPPSLHYEQPNPRIDFANSPFYVNAQLSEWKAGEFPRRAGINSFGIGGTNAHVILEEAPPVEISTPARPEQLLVLSAKTDSALETATTNLLEHLKQHPDLNLADAAYTLQVGRRAFDRRRVLVCRDIEDAVSALETLDAACVLTSRQESTERPITFMFSGQGTQYVNMARGLYEHEPTFRQQVDLCTQLLTPHLGLDLREVIYPRAEQTEEAARQLQQTRLAQPALFVIEYALAQLWMEWGVRPTAMIGHSLGEYVAACLAGVFSLEDALALVAARGRLMQAMPVGSMIAIPLPEQEVRSFLNGKLSLAAVNAANLCVVSGPSDAVHELEAELTNKGLVGQLLHTSHAFHSEMMQPVLDSFVEQFKSVRLQPPQIPYVSNLTGTWITPTEACDPNYWASHLRQTVRFSEGLEQLLAGEGILLEVGPGQTLCTLVKQQNGKAARQIVLSSLRHPHDRQADERFLLNTLGRLWLSGMKVDWSGFHKNAKRSRTPLPTYPFERQRYWVEAQSEAASDSSSTEVSLEKKPDIADWFYIPSWKRSASPEVFQQPSAQKSRWLLFTDKCGMGAHLSERLESAGKDVCVVAAGEQFAKHSERAYTINPRERADYDALFKELHALNRPPEVIVHLWNVTMEEEAQSEFDSFEKFQALGFNSLLFLAQALGEQLEAGNQLKVAVVSNQLQDVTGEETLCPSKATLLGPCKVMPEEYPQLACRSIDIELPKAGALTESKLLDQLFAELNADTNDPLVAYRGKHRWVQTYEAVRLNEAIEPKLRLRESGVYLITGGLGGIGLTIAEHLARLVRARLVLLGRSSFPAREEWDSWLATHDDNERTSRTIQRLQSFEETGAEVMIASADVADMEAMRDVVKLCKARFGQINGVVHSAGVAGGRMIQLQTPLEAARVLSPKALGTLVLDAILKDEALDFFVLCSSLTSILGALGQVDYCGANAFLDAFAQQASSRDGKPVVSVNWDTWQEVGMAVNTIVPRDMEEMRAESLKQGILPLEGVEALTRIMSTTLAQVAVSTTTLTALIEQRDQEETASSEDEREEAQPVMHKPLYARPALSNDYVAPRDEVEQDLAGIWQKLLGVEQVGIHDNFFELGGHSLLAVQLISRLREAFHVELTVRHLFDAPTIALLARNIAQTREATHEQNDQIDQMLKLVEQLSENEIQDLLSEQRDQREGVDYT
ncbi:MAG TPA: SDR family NAD(P)-dependent oxidoreductase [Pyrinomonadaceae bacterium]|nr:SDR family NAD(P)-dependent oxidoreductase [Pyrinomonadaceae bacterium]